MKSELILIANATEARFFIHRHGQERLAFLETLEHPEGRLKASELGDDRPGHGSSDQRPGGVPFTPRTDPHRKAHLQFAHRLADRIDELMAEGGLDGIVLFASSPFLGELKAAMSAASQKVVHATADVDLTSVPAGELSARLDEELRQRGRGAGQA
jgi:protein required for attachment to host cells